MPLTAKQEQFCREYLVDLNATQAAIRAGYSVKTANEMAGENLAKPSIKARISELIDERSQRVEVTADDVLRRLWMVATADANELIELRRECCRYCYGVGFRYQRTTGEMDHDRAVWKRKAKRASEGEKKKQVDPFDEMGGGGFDRRKPPNQKCPECYGEGIERPFPKDTRNLSPAARLLYAGVKVTKDGLEIKTRDQDAALLNVGKHLGLFPNKVEHTGKDGGPIVTVNWDDLARAAREPDPIDAEIVKVEQRALPEHGTNGDGKHE